MRDNYKLKFIEASQATLELDHKLNGLKPSHTINPPFFKGVYASLVLNDLQSDQDVASIAKQTSQALS